MTPHLHCRYVQMLRLRYGFDTGEPMTLDEVADAMDDVSRQSAHWMESRALHMIRLYPYVLDGSDFTDEQKAILQYSFLHHRLRSGLAYLTGWMRSHYALPPHHTAA